MIVYIYLIFFLSLIALSFFFAYFFFGFTCQKKRLLGRGGAEKKTSSTWIL